MDTSYAYNAYSAHDLNIEMRTSSGDVIKMDFANHNSTSLSQEKNENSSKTSMSFSSMQSFQFSVDSNGIDAQDQQEIDKFMKIAQPFIDDFLQELQEDAPKTPVTKLANEIAAIFNPDKERNENSNNYTKNSIVELFDNSLQKLELPDAPNMQEKMDKIFADAQKLLEKTLQSFENFHQDIYA